MQIKTSWSKRRRCTNGCYKGKEKTLGPSHASTLNTVNNLGILYMKQDKLAEAEDMQQRALQGYEKTLNLGPSSSYIPALNAAYNMGLLFAQHGNENDARRM
jgi:tetratricopeptide (TPR) repeat protein